MCSAGLRFATGEIMEFSVFYHKAVRKGWSLDRLHRAWAYVQARRERWTTDPAILEALIDTGRVQP